MLKFVFAITAFAAIALLLSRTRARRMRVLRWVVGPVVIVAAGLNWIVADWLSSPAENCESECLSSGDVRTARMVLVLVLTVWFVGLIIHAIRRDDP